MNTSVTIASAFDALESYRSSLESSGQQDLALLSQLSSRFSLCIQKYSARDFFKEGDARGYPSMNVLNLLLIHGGYVKALSEGCIRRSSFRYFDSLFLEPFIPLKYYSLNSDLTAPWITLPAQEALLDIDLSQFIVIEYGSGISTFFFAREAKACYSFESNSDMTGGGDWSSKMHETAAILDLNLHLIEPSSGNTSPSNVISDYCDQDSPLLISIDGEFRKLHLAEWSSWLIRNPNSNVIIVLDNSENIKFAASLNDLSSAGAAIINYYGPVYGQAFSRQCTTIITFNPRLLVSKSISPALHDKRWSS